jgi:hypothetical protein
VAKDAELDRLTTTQDQTFKRQQDAWQAQDQAWKQRSSARDALEKAYQDKQRAYEVQESTWQDFLRAKQDGPRIDSLNAQQEAAFQNMKTAFDNASAAYNSRNGAAAGSYAAEGHRYKAEAQRHVAERRLIVDKIRAARARHEATKPAFQTAKAQFAQVKAAYDRAKEDHVRKQDEFKRAKAEFVTAKDAFHKRLAVVQADSKKRKDDKRALAERAGVPYQYRDDVYITWQLDGTVNIYFGGLGTPDGPGHGHYALTSSGEVPYKRDPFDPHGAQNFEGPGKDGHSGGFSQSHHGWIDGHPVTFAFGWGTRRDHTLIADGHLSWEAFRDSPNHDHYGPGDGPSNNGTLRRTYTGPGA